MQAVSATTAQLTLGSLLDAAQAEPILIRRNHQDIAVVISATEYSRLSAPAWRRPVDERLIAMLDGCD